MSHSTPSRPVRIALFGASLFISAIFIDSLRFKFTGHPTPEHIFTTLRDWSGIGLFYPAGPWIIGIAELAAAVLLVAIPVILWLTKGDNRLAALSQALGALIALGVMTGAITFHLFTPLGIATPTEWENGVIVEEGSFLFIAACISWVFALFILVLRGKDALGYGRSLIAPRGATLA
ncbi:hypothetical protein [Aquisalinus flavus]|uniref:Uncharacterized protein n=1 Tax=Aquisalinus flavus TaxID=1526572 RepID=A0A8J2Y809_9PROT|nr:hypothetical protein [Aquisalinus flavus]MBD0426068.1 hypothetical protein [Aquisalinus flavus]UNE48347.1 hypothetical protein FF099_09935 [Aquisalinus flavus]GGD10953.1 hypothetical protein GCM10011342_19720 [Aquisalinus flavus]